MLRGICMPNLQDSFIILHMDKPFSRSRTLFSHTVSQNLIHFSLWAIRVFSHLYCLVLTSPGLLPAKTPVAISSPAFCSTGGGSALTEAPRKEPSFLTSLRLHNAEQLDQTWKWNQTLLLYKKVAQLLLWHLSLQLYNCFTAPEGGERWQDAILQFGSSGAVIDGKCLFCNLEDFTNGENIF